MEWSVNENVFRLIELYRMHPQLYSCKKLSTQAKKVKNAAWNAISKEIGIPRIDVEKKMRSLVAQFDREQKKIEASTPVDVYETKWFAYKPLSFLIDRYNKTKPTANKSFHNASVSHGESVSDPDECSRIDSISISDEVKSEVSMDMYEDPMSSTRISQSEHHKKATNKSRLRIISEASIDNFEESTHLIKSSLSKVSPASKKSRLRIIGEASINNFNQSTSSIHDPLLRQSAAKRSALRNIKGSTNEHFEEASVNNFNHPTSSIRDPLQRQSVTKRSSLRNIDGASLDNFEESTSSVHNSLQLQPEQKRSLANISAQSISSDRAVDIVKTAMNLRPERDEYSVFGETVAFKVRKLSTNYARSTVQHLINNILYESELGKYNKPPEEIF